MTPELALLLVRRALRGAEHLSIEERADLHTAAGEALKIAKLDVQAEVAFAAAHNLREASAAQMHFAALLND